MSNETELKVLEVIARIKSNLGSNKDWARDLEEALGIEEMQANL
jgi:hypothetical protein